MIHFGSFQCPCRVCFSSEWIGIEMASPHAQPLPRATLGDYLDEPEPLIPIWRALVRIVYRDSPRLAHLERLTPPARVLFLTAEFEGEILNGGMSQFLTNSSGSHVAETLEALRAIQADLSVGLLEKALTIFPNGVAPIDRGRRCELVKRNEQTDPKFLASLTHGFLCGIDAEGIDREEELSDLCLNFMQARRDERLLEEVAAL